MMVTPCPKYDHTSLLTTLRSTISSSSTKRASSCNAIEHEKAVCSTGTNDPSKGVKISMKEMMIEVMLL
jgi:hypothetical protein